MNTAKVIALPGIWKPFALPASLAGVRRRVLPKPSPRRVPPKPVKHRKAPKYLDLSRDRAAWLVTELERQGVIVAKHRSIAQFAIWCALDDARSAGFGAGVAYGLSRGR